jgi:hypothetical protein
VNAQDAQFVRRAIQYLAETMEWKTESTEKLQRQFDAVIEVREIAGNMLVLSKATGPIGDGNACWSELDLALMRTVHG